MPRHSRRRIACRRIAARTAGVCRRIRARAQHAGVRAPAARHHRSERRRPSADGICDGQGSLIYNGELYNYLELRAELVRAATRALQRARTARCCWRHCITGGRRMRLRKVQLDGRVRVARPRAGRLVLACDAGSEKPLYYCVDGPRFAFASEIKTLLTLAGTKVSAGSRCHRAVRVSGLERYVHTDVFRRHPALEAGTLPRARRDSRTAGDPAGPLSSRRLTRRSGAGCRSMSSSRSSAERSSTPCASGCAAMFPSASCCRAASIRPRSPRSRRSLAGRETAPRLLSAVSDDPRLDESPHIDVMERHLQQRVRQDQAANGAGKLRGRTVRGELVQRCARRRIVRARAPQTHASGRRNWDSP